MKKIPTLFIREFENHYVKSIEPVVTPGMEWVLRGEGEATIKWDGSCCAIIDEELYKRYDAKNGKPVPIGAIQCEDAPDPVTGHLPCWVKCDVNNPGDKWFEEAYENSNPDLLGDGTYEAVGPHFQRNPYRLEKDKLIRHGIDIVDVPRSFEGIKKFLEDNDIEGLVFWKDGEPRCKIKRKDFGLPWNRP